MQRAKAAPPDPLSAALRMLARRPYSVAEMRRALQKKFPDSSQVPKAIARLRELHYLDDKKFAEHYASSLARNRAYGRYRIRRELKAKLVDYRQIEPALQQAFGETSEAELLEQTLAKKLRTLRLPLTRPRFHSLCQSLLRRGFNSGDIIKAVRARPELQPVAEEVEAVDLESGEKGNSE
ncbi:MAG: RecX family transcriptional regulator [Terriglobia bacterium]